MSETAASMRARVRQLRGQPAELLAMRQEVVALRVAVEQLGTRLAEQAAAQAQAQVQAQAQGAAVADPPTEEGPADARLAALESALDAVAGRLEAAVRDAASDSSARIDELTQTLTALTERTSRQESTAARSVAPEQSIPLARAALEQVVAAGLADQRDAVLEEFRQLRDDLADA